MRWISIAAGVATMFALPLTAQAAGTQQGAGWFAGAVTSAGPSSVSVDVLWTGKHDTQLNGTQVTVGIDSSTRITYGKGRSSISAGELIGVRATGVGSNVLTAKRIHVRCNCHYAFGTLGSIGSGSFAVDVTRTGPYDTVLKGNAVTFQLGSTSTANLKTGDKVGVIFSATGFFKDPNFNWRTATFTASRVHFRG